jgi:hypothetical protein
LDAEILSLGQNALFFNLELMMDEYFRLGLELLGVMTGMGLAIQAGGATVAWGSQVWGWQRRASFLDKFGRQMLGLSMVGFLGAVFCALAGLGLGHVRYGLQIQSAAVAGLPWLAVSWPLAGLGLGLVFSLLAAKTWKPLKRRKAMQALVLLPAWLSLWAGLYTGLNIYSQGFLHMFSPIQAPGLEAVWQVQLSPAWVLLAGQALVVGLGGAGAAGMAYLLARRNIEDFGRDYYRFALPHAAKWAAVLLGQALFLAWVVDRQALAVWLLPCREMIALGAALGGFVVYGVLLIVFLRSDNPLRAKASALGASGVGIAAAAAAALSQLWLWS